MLFLAGQPADFVPPRLQSVARDSAHVTNHVRGRRCCDGLRRVLPSFAMAKTKAGLFLSHYANVIAKVFSGSPNYASENRPRSAIATLSTIRGHRCLCRPFQPALCIVPPQTGFSVGICNQSQGFAVGFLTADRAFAKFHIVRLPHSYTRCR